MPFSEDVALEVLRLSTCQFDWVEHLGECSRCNDTYGSIHGCRSCGEAVCLRCTSDESYAVCFECMTRARHDIRAAVERKLIAISRGLQSATSEVLDRVGKHVGLPRNEWGSSILESYMYHKCPLDMLADYTYRAGLIDLIHSRAEVSDLLRDLDAGRIQQLLSDLDEVAWLVSFTGPIPEVTPKQMIQECCTWNRETQVAIRSAMGVSEETLTGFDEHPVLTGENLDRVGRYLGISPPVNEPPTDGEYRSKIMKELGMDKPLSKKTPIGFGRYLGVSDGVAEKIDKALSAVEMESPIGEATPEVVHAEPDLTPWARSHCPDRSWEAYPIGQAPGDVEAMRQALEEEY